MISAVVPFPTDCFDLICHSKCRFNAQTTHSPTPTSLPPPARHPHRVYKPQVIKNSKSIPCESFRFTRARPPRTGQLATVGGNVMEKSLSSCFAFYSGSDGAIIKPVNIQCVYFLQYLDAVIQLLSFFSCCCWRCVQPGTCYSWLTLAIMQNVTKSIYNAVFRPTTHQLRLNLKAAVVVLWCAEKKIVSKWEARGAVVAQNATGISRTEIRSKVSGNNSQNQQITTFVT